MSTSCHGHLGPGSEGPRRRPAGPGNSRSSRKAHVFDQLSRTNRAHVRWPAGSTSCPGLLGPGPDVPCGRPGVPDDSRLSLIARGVDPHSQANHVHTEGPRVRPDDFGHSSLVPRDRGVNQVSWATRARARGPAGSTRCPGRLRPSSEGLRCQPAVLGHSHFGRVPAGSTRCPGAWGLGPNALGFHQQSHTIRALVRGPAVSTICPG